jgi:Lipocalin-like domain
MNRCSSILSLYALVLCVGAMTASSAMAQQKSLKEQLIGIWTFASSIDTNKDGTKTNRWGPNAKGQLMLDPSGRFSFLISRASIPKFAASNVNQGTAEENKAVVQGIIAYIGTWSVDDATKTLTTNIEAGSYPNLNGGTQKRIITSLTADELKYTNPATTTGTSSDVVWRRAK